LLSSACKHTQTPTRVDASAAHGPLSQAIADAADPAASVLPSPWQARLSPFQRLLLLRVLRPDKLTSAMHGFVRAALGPRFVESPPLDLEACLADSSATTPLIFVLSPGSDPMSMLLKHAERLKVQASVCVFLFASLDPASLH
jgi:hypothetical protein